MRFPEVRKRASPPRGILAASRSAKAHVYHRAKSLSWLAMLIGLLLGGVAGCDRDVPKVQVEKSPIQRQVSGTTSYASIVDKVAPSVVSVYTRREIRGRAMPPILQDPLFRRFFGNGEQMPQPQPRQQQGLGSGVIISPDGYILSNNHVVEGAEEIIVATADGREYKARVVGTDPPTDIAVLKIEANDLPAAILAESQDLRVGDIVLAIGNPFGVGQTVTAGIISATERSGFGITDYEDFIQTDASINPGNSGGALVDAQGRVIGISTAILSRSGGFMGIGFAVPVSLARFVMEQIIREGRVIRGYLGVYVQPITPELAKAFELPTEQGALVAGVTPESPAETAGLKEGDVIVAANGKPVESSRELRLMMAQTSPGTKVELVVIRQGERRTLAATLNELPREQPKEGRSGFSPPEPQNFLEGVELQALSPQTRRQLDLPSRLQGALVTSVDPWSTAYQAGLRTGNVIVEVNRQRVGNPEEAATALQQSTADAVLLRVWAEGGIRYLVVGRR